MTTPILGCAIALVLAAVPPMEAPKASGEPIDVVLAIDSSLSLRRSDPRGFGREVARDIIDFLRAGDRIAVVRFAGWEETIERGAIVQSISEIPEDAEERKVFTERYRAAVEKGLGEFGRGTDFNVAFQEGVFRCFGGAEGLGRDRPAWIIVYTDGGMDVIEGSRIRERYLTEVGGDGTPEREALNKAAIAVLEKEVVPYLKRNGVTVTVLYPGALRPEQRVAPLPSRLPARRADGLETLFWILKRMGQQAGLEKEGSESLEVSSGAPLLYPFRLPQGVVSAKMLVFGEVADFTVDVTGPRGTSLEREGTVRVARGGRLYRVVEISNPESGDHLLTVETPVEGTARFLVRLDTEQDLSLTVNLPEDGEVYHPGEPIPIVAGLAVASTGAAVTDPDMLRSFESTVRVEDPSGNIERTPVPPSTRGPAKFDLRLPISAVPGRYRLRLEGKLGGLAAANPEIVLDPVEAEFTLHGLLTAEFAEETTFSGKAVRIVGLSEPGTAKLQGATVIVSSEDPMTSREVPLSSAGEHLEGTVTLIRDGKWHLDGGTDGNVDVLPGVRHTIQVNVRRIEVFPLPPGSTGFPAQRLDQATLRETEGGFVGRVGVRYDMVPGEEGKIEAVLLRNDNVEEGPVLLDGRKVASLSGDERERIFEIRPSGPIVEGRIEFKAALGDFKNRDEVKVRWLTAEREAEPVARGKTLLMAAGGVVALFLFLALLRWVRTPHFRGQRLWCTADEETTEHWLKEMRKGFLGNRAVGTPEVPFSVEFVLKSRRQAAEGRCLLRPLQQTDTVYVNQFALAGPLEVKHGAEIIIERDGFPVRYIYYGQEPTLGAQPGDETQTLEALERPVPLDEEASVGPDDQTQLE